MLFHVKNALGKIYSEIVDGCDSVESYINQHFGSIIPSDHGMEVTMDDVSTEPTPQVSQSQEQSEATEVYDQGED
jgi:hypothetical protein